MGRSSEKLRLGVRNPGRRTFLHAGLVGAGLGCIGGAPANQAAEEEWGEGEALLSGNPYCPMALVAQVNGLYYYSTMQCKSPYRSSSMTSSVKYSTGCGNTATPPCQPTLTLSHKDGDDEAAGRTDRHAIDTKGRDLAKLGLLQKLPVGEHFSLTAAQGVLVGPEYDYPVTLDTGDIVYVRVALILGVPQDDLMGAPAAPVLMGLGQELEKDSGSTTTNHKFDVRRMDKKYIVLVRKKDLIHLHVLLG
jgi:hypothetical protein